MLRAKLNSVEIIPELSCHRCGLCRYFKPAVTALGTPASEDHAGECLIAHKRFSGKFLYSNAVWTDGGEDCDLFSERKVHGL